MAGVFTAIDLSRLPSPDVVETLDFETILSDMQADLIARDPDLAPVLALESEPLNKLLEVCAFRELLLRQRINDAARARMLAYATEKDLEQIAANYNEERRMIDPGNPNVIPPVLPTYESDDVLRQRCLLAMEGLSNAGTVGSYTYHAIKADARVKDASVISPQPGSVAIYVLSIDGNGTPSADIQQAVQAAVGSDDIRALCDTVSVLAATVVEYAVDATLIVYPGPDAGVVRQACIDACQQYVTEHHKLGHDITRSGLFAALHQPGVQNVILNSPAQDLVIGSDQAAYCTGMNVVIGGTDE